MPVQVIVDGIPVTLDTRLWSFDSTIRPLTPNAYIGSELHDPIEVYRTQPSVRTVIDFLARNIAQVALHGFGTGDNGDRDRLPSIDALPMLLKSPSPTATAFTFMKTLVTDVCLWDRYAAAITDNDGVLDLVRLPPDLWKFDRDGLRRPTGVVVTNGDGEDRVIKLSELLWLDGYPSGCKVSPMEGLCDLLAEERESSKYRRELLEGGGRFPGWLTRPSTAPPWTTPKTSGGTSGRDRFREGWQKFASGGLKVGTTPILEDDMSYHEAVNGITPETAQQLETRKFSKAEVAAYFHLPPVFVGLVDGSNYSNVTAYREILYSDVLGTWFQEIQQAYNARLLRNPLVAADPMSEFVEFNVAEKLRMSFDQQAKVFQTATGGPFMTRNEARKRLNLPSIDGADELVVPLNVLTGAQASPTDSGSQNEE